MSEELCVIGLGYIGLPTAVIFANNGFEVMGVDVDDSKVAMVNNGRSYLKELSLTIFLKRLSSKKSLELPLILIRL